MKKTRILAFLITVCMATTAFLGSAVAKYTTNANIEDSATVAKWGIKLTMSGSLFEDAYNKAGDNNTGNDPAVATLASGSLTSDSETAISVYSLNSSNLVAPGTKGNTLTVSLKGTAEVDTSVTVSTTSDNATISDVYLKAGSYATMLKLGTITKQEFDLRKGDLFTYTSNTYSPVGDNAYSPTTDYYFIQNKATVTATKNDGDSYYPVVYKLTDASTTVAGIVTAQDVYNYIQKDLVGESATYKDYGTNFDFGANNQFVYTITWEWAFGTDDDADTILGYLASNDADTDTNNDVIVVKAGTANGTYVAIEDSDYNLTTNFNIKITVDQVD